jgi:hypothetical protein
MQLQARLVHAESGRRVVEVSAHRNGELLGSTLGEGATAEEAEDRALARLQARLGQPQSTAPQAPAPGVERKAEPPKRVEPPARPQPAKPQPPVAADPQPDAEALSDEGQTSLQLPALPKPPAPTPGGPEVPLEPEPDPEDWSSELAQIDLQLKRLGWQREQESVYLERAFGHPSRSRLTTYGDLLGYLQSLQGLEPGADPQNAPVPLRRRDLLAQCDGLLGQLQWDASQGRQFLEKHFQVQSRQQLSDTQLLQFNMLLEGELIGV